MTDLGRCALGALLCLALAGCGERARGSADRFTANGRVIALSGGDGGGEAACIGCHGLRGEGNGAGAPRLAGLDRGYLVGQLDAYADGRRAHPEMAAIAKKLTGAQRQAVSGYYAALSAPVTSLSATPPTLWTNGDPARRLQPCAACHGAQAEGAGLGNPALAGQPAEYLSQQLHAWRRSERRSDGGNVMLEISRQLTPAEIQALARYAAGEDAGPPRPEYRAASR